MTRLAGSSKLLRAMNESATLALLLERGTLTRAELRELTGLSKPTTSDVLRTLTDAGFATVIGHTSGGPGPNAEIYAVNPSAAHVVAISVRDTTETPHPAVGASLCDLTGTVLAQAEYPAEAGDPLDVVKRVVTDLCKRAGIEVSAVTHVQLAVPGSYDAGSETIRHIDVSGWGRPGLVTELANRLDTTVWAENDVNLAAIAERHRGVAAGSDAFAMLWLGAGLGCAIDLGGNLLRGVSGGAGEIGYVPLGQSGKDLQDFVGGPAVLTLAAEHGFTAATAEAAVADAVAFLGGELAAKGAGTKGAAAKRGAIGDATLKDGAAKGAAAKGGGTDAQARAGLFLHALADRIALVLAAVSALLDPPLVVLAGEVAQAGGAMLRDLVAEAFHGATPLRTPVQVTSLTDDAVLLGALDAGLRTVRESLIDSLRHALTPV